jgi:hypothetical protein
MQTYSCFGFAVIQEQNKINWQIQCLKQKRSLYYFPQSFHAQTSECGLNIIAMIWTQVITCVSKANQMMGMIKKCFIRLDLKILRSLYLSQSLGLY